MKLHIFHFYIVLLFLPPHSFSVNNENGHTLDLPSTSATTHEKMQPNCNKRNRVYLLNLAIKALQNCKDAWREHPEDIRRNYETHKTKNPDPAITENEIENPLPVLEQKINEAENLLAKISKDEFTYKKEFSDNIQPIGIFTHHRAKCVFRAPLSIRNRYEWFEWP